MADLDKIRLIIDGKNVEARSGMTVLEVAQEVGIYIPTLCFDPDLEPFGGCRLCVIEVEGMRGLPTACTTPVTDGMVVQTSTPEINQVRFNTVELILADHPIDCLTCVKNQKCELQEVAPIWVLPNGAFVERQKSVRLIPATPFSPLTATTVFSARGAPVPVMK